MKISTIKALLDIATDIAIVEELTAELAKMEVAEQRKANRNAAARQEYENAKQAVMEVFDMVSVPVTTGEIYEEVAANLPSGFTKNKIAYALTHYWTDEIVAVNNGRKAKTYQRRTAD